MLAPRRCRPKRRIRRISSRRCRDMRRAAVRTCPGRFPTGPCRVYTECRGAICPMACTEEVGACTRITQVRWVPVMARTAKATRTPLRPHPGATPPRCRRWAAGLRWGACTPSTRRHRAWASCRRTSGSSPRSATREGSPWSRRRTCTRTAYRDTSSSSPRGSSARRTEWASSFRRSCPAPRTSRGLFRSLSTRAGGFACASSPTSSGLRHM
mmetsp:Transcript_78345/g.199158  ORF Transcript_78345/g.199158 Transcript_78345/m.199158 type:complete len:212 (-) Transcript_78345:626-1261(-)